MKSIKAIQSLKKKWVLSLARKTTGSHQEHAFFILEGIQDGKACIWFMDFVGNPLIPNLIKGKVRIKPDKNKDESLSYQAITIEELKKSPLIYRCPLKMMDLKPGQQIAKQIWSVSQQDAVQLIQAMEYDKLNPPNFNILGRNSIFNRGSAITSSTEAGYNCFTYAKKKITDLDSPNIKIESNTLADWAKYFASPTSLTIGGSSSLLTFCFWATTAAVAIVTPMVAYGIKAATSYYSSPK